MDKKGIDHSGETLYTGNGTAIIPGYTAFGSNVFLAGSTITIPGYTAFGRDVYIAGSNYNICGKAHSPETYYKGNGASVTGRGDPTKAIAYNGTLYEAGPIKTVIGDKPSQTLYYRDTDFDLKYTTIGSKPNQTLYYRDTDGDRTVACAGEACSVKLATLITREATVLGA